MKRILAIILSFLAVSSFAQKVLFTIDTMPVYADEFLYMYKKNNKGADSLPVDKYLDLFINYKLKVYEALQRGYDKDSGFKAEYEKYLLEAAKPYFESKNLENKLVREYYDRYKKQVRFSFLVKQLPQNATPADTLQLYNELSDIRSKALNGEDFAALVREYTDLERSKANGGDAGYMSVFSLPQEFINFLWTHKVGDISKPIRFRNAYYLLKITGERPNPGDVHIAQIYLALPQNAPEKDSLAVMEKMRKIDSALAAGADFAQLAREYSEDYRSARRGGDLGWIKPGQTIPKFEQAAYSLKKPGDITKVRTKLGYHYIKLIERRPVGSFEQEKDKILARLKRLPVYRQVTDAVLDSLKKVYGYKQTGSLEPFYQIPADELFPGKWKDSSLLGNNTVLFKIGGQVYTYGEFAQYLIDNARVQLGKTDMKSYVDRQYKKFVDDKVKRLYVKQLANKQNTEFGHLAKEFYDGLLLFNISNDVVWSKAAKDTAGLLKFYKKHRKNYDTLEYVTIVEGPAENINNLYKQLKKRKLAVLDTQFLNKYGDTLLVLKDKIVISPSNKKYAQIYELVKSKPGKRVFITVQNSGNAQLVYRNDKLSQIRGLVIADYQDYLEQQWLKQLHKKYKVKINYDVLKQIEEQLKQQGK